MKRGRLRNSSGGERLALVLPADTKLMSIVIRCYVARSLYPRKSEVTSLSFFFCRFFPFLFKRLARGFV